LEESQPDTFENLADEILENAIDFDNMVEQEVEEIVMQILSRQ